MFSMDPRTDIDGLSILGKLHASKEKIDTQLSF